MHRILEALRTLYLLLAGLLCLGLEVLLFLPRYLLLERHDRRSAVWGARAEAVVLFSHTSWGYDVVRRIECLNVMGHSAAAGAGATRVEERKNSLSASVSTSQQQVLLDDDDESEDWESCSGGAAGEDGAAVVADTLSKWLQGTAVVFMKDRRARSGESLSTTMTVTAAEGCNMLQGVFADGATFVAYSLLQHEPADEVARRQQGHHSHKLCLSERGTDTLSCWFRDEANSQQPLCVPYKRLPTQRVAPCRLWSQARSDGDDVAGSGDKRPVKERDVSRRQQRQHSSPPHTQQRKGFIPPWYAVHGKAQLLLSLIDPLWRILMELIDFHNTDGGAEPQPKSPSVLLRDAPCKESDSSSSSSSSKGPAVCFSSPVPRWYAFGVSQRNSHAVPAPLEEVCFIPPTAVEVLLTRFCGDVQQRQKQENDREQADEPDNERPRPCGYVPSLTPMKSSMKYPYCHSASSTHQCEGAATNDDDSALSKEAPEKSNVRKRARISQVFSIAWRQDTKNESGSTDHTGTTPLWSHRATGLKWLHGSAPSTGSDALAPVVVLLLCPSVAQGNEHGNMARRIGALCQALTMMSALRRQCRHRSGSNECYSQQQSNLRRTSHEGASRMSDANGLSFASWHAAVPFAEMVNWPAGYQPSAAEASQRERVPVTAEDIDHVVSHLCRLRRVAVPPPSGTDNATMEVRYTDEDAELQSTELPRLSGVPQHHEHAVNVTRSVYVVGIGWSNASGPLLQHVMTHGTQSRIDGLVCINHTLSSNFRLAPGPAVTGLRGRSASYYERQLAVRVCKMPFDSTFLSDSSGAARLLLLAARLQMVADRLHRPWRRQQQQEQKQDQHKKIVLWDDENDAALWEYVQSTMDERTCRPDAAKSGEFAVPRPPPAHLHPPVLPLASGSTRIDALVRAEAHVDREVSEWWLDDVRSKGGGDNINNNNNSSSSSSGVASPSSTGGWQPAMSLTDWDALLNSKDDVSAATFLAANCTRSPSATPANPVAHATMVLPQSVVENNDGIFSLDSTRNTGGGDADAQQHLRISQESTTRRVSPLFDMARGQAEMPLPMHATPASERNCSGAVAGKTRKVKGDERLHSGPALNLALMTLRLRHANNAQLVSLIHVPTLFVHARDDAVAPLSTLPMRECATNPKIFTVLTRRGGHGLFLEGVSALFTLPRLALQERPRRPRRNTDNNNTSGGGGGPVNSGKAREAARQSRRSSASIGIGTLHEGDSQEKKEQEDDVETVFVIEGTTWLERLVVEFVASAVVTQPPRC